MNKPTPKLTPSPAPQRMRLAPLDSEIQNEPKSLNMATWKDELEAIAFQNGCILLVDLDTGGCYYREIG